MRNTRLTTRQSAMLRFIRQHLQKRGYAPTIREIGDACDISSSSVVLSNLRGLAKKGRIVRQENTSRAIGLIEPAVSTIAVSRRLEKARHAVRLAKDRVDHLYADGVPYPSELDEARAAYYEASEEFLKAYDAVCDTPVSMDMDAS